MPILLVGLGVFRAAAVPTGAGQELLYNNVGIGSANPGTNLDVVGTVRATGFSGNGSALTNVNTPNFWLNDSGNVGINTNYNVGLGTNAQVNTLNILGNVGISQTAGDSYLTTAAPNGGIIVEGNLGIGSLGPTQPLDVKGTLRATGFILTGNNAAAGSMLTSTSVGLGTWQTPNLVSSANLTTAVANEVTYYSSASALNGNSAFLFDGNNVGIGTNALNASLAIMGNVGIGSTANDPYLKTPPPTGGMIISGNTGIGTFAPLVQFQAGTYVSGDSGFFVDSKGNIGIGTFKTSQAAMSIMGGNMGIGTWAPSAPLVINAPSTDIGLDIETAATGSGANSLGDWLLKDTSGNVKARFMINGEAFGSVMNTISTTNTVIGEIEGLNTAATTGDFRLGRIQYLTSDSTITGKLVFYTATGTAGNFNANIVMNYAGTTFIGHSINNGATIVAASTVDVGGNMTVGSSYAGVDAAPANGLLVQGNLGIGTFKTTNDLDVAGNIGIGTLYASIKAAPTSGLIVFGNVGIGTWLPGSALIVASGNVGINTDFANYNLQVGGCASKNGTSSCVDVAESITASEPVGSGDLVMLDKNEPVTVTKAVAAKSALLLGVVTTDPAIVIEGDTVGILNGSGFEANPRKPAVALAGRIPVKVNLQNGPIAIGDMITASVNPGIGTKAIASGKVAGMAMEPLDSLEGKPYRSIKVYVNPHWYYKESFDSVDEKEQSLINDVNRLEERDKALEDRLTALEQKRR